MKERQMRFSMEKICYLLRGICSKCRYIKALQAINLNYYVISCDFVSFSNVVCQYYLTLIQENENVSRRQPTNIMAYSLMQKRHY